MRIARLIAMTALVTPLFGCPPDPPDDNGGPQTPPTVSFKLFDAPPPGVTSATLNFVAIQVHVDDPSATESKPETDETIDQDGRWKSLPFEKAIDLVQHVGEAAAIPTDEIVLPEGKITQLRLVLDTTKPAPITTEVNGQATTCDIDLSSVSQTGIKINHVFKAIEAKNGEKLQLFVDFDLGESLRTQGDCYKMRPVVKLPKAVKNGQEVPLQ